MPLRALFSFDVYPNAPNGPSITQAIRKIVGERKMRRLLQRLWQIDFKDEGDFEFFGKSLAKLHDTTEAGEVFDYVALLWRTNSQDVFVIGRPGSGPQEGEKSVEVVATHVLGEQGIEAFFNNLENSRAFRDLSFADTGRVASPVFIPVVATVPSGGDAPRPRRTRSKGTVRRQRS